MKSKEKKKNFPRIVKLRDIKYGRQTVRKIGPAFSKATGKQVSRTSHSWEYCFHDYNSAGEAVVEVHLSAVFSHGLYQFRRIRK